MALDSISGPAGRTDLRRCCKPVIGHSCIMSIMARSR
ncbi:hypothetical protein ABID95_007151 [Streptomyces atratus]